MEIRQSISRTGNTFSQVDFCAMMYSSVIYVWGCFGIDIIVFWEFLGSAKGL